MQPVALAAAAEHRPDASARSAAAGLHKPVLRHRFFIARYFSRCGKNFCVVKRRAAWHNGARCSMGNHIPHCEIHYPTRCFYKIKYNT
ncbi:hypothetical protein FNF07_01650 [Trinickia caryophylli]|nr:hypothetical protein C0Z17_09865 [Trinickia caryophylli]TRX17059.1 hypothetical protein FNF07_01650 [Trinickia caryophylli]